MSKIWHSLQFKIPAVFIVSFLLILAAIVGVFSTLGETLLEKQAYKEVSQSGKHIVSELGKRVALAESLATALANLGEQLPPDNEMHKHLINKVMDYEGTEAFIAGGGVWPAEFRYDPAIERRSFFWGRDSDGKLQYFDDYNDPLGPGYHHEEWYVPAKHLKEGEAFWSKSYMDPYSYQPMVTVTVPMYRNNEFYGVSTIDLKLEGLHELLKEISQSFGGYAFAVDRNGKFLSFPDESLTKLFGQNQRGQRTEEFINVSDLAEQQDKFRSLADIINETKHLLIANSMLLGTYNKDLGKQIASDSYQIDRDEAELISASIASLQSRATRSELIHYDLFLDNDLLLGEAAFASVYEMPKTYWKIVTVMPYSKAIVAPNLIFKNLVSSIALVMLASFAVTLFLVRRFLVSPIRNLSTQLQRLVRSNKPEKRTLTINDKGELGELAYWFNQRSKKLYATQTELEQAQQQLEQRVIERTDELRQEIEKRKADQEIKEQRVTRVERQHAAIVHLSMQEALFRGDIIAAARLINETVTQIIDTARATIWLLDDSGETLQAVDMYDRNCDTHSDELSVSLADCPSFFEALNKERSISVYDVYEDMRTQSIQHYTRQFGIHSLLISTIRSGGKLAGLVCIEETAGKRRWHSDEVRFSGEVADQYLQVLANADRTQSQEKIQQLAFYDPLTQLANRRLLHEEMCHEIEVARRQGVFGSLIYLDLDNFKTLNDSLGHHIGDELLKQLAQRLVSVLRKDDIASRLGGDEFVVLITGEYSTRQQAMDQALHVAHKIQDIINTPYRLQEYDHIVTASIGITLYPDNEDDASDVLKQADTAMYRAKSSGRNAISFYSPEMQKAANARLTLEKEVRTAISDHEFEMFFQPQIDCEGNVVAAEALVRWAHPERGIISPDDFIPLAEETGLILELGEWILQSACEINNQCNLKQVSVNISPLQFRHPNFVEMVSRILRQTGSNPESLMIEITEGIVIQNIDDTVHKMNALKAMGIRISIDDFGTGYSSLAYLKKLPLDQLKINDSFVKDITSDPNDAILVETIISMAHHLQLDLVAEGVETDTQIQFLTEKGCHVFQGYYFSKPLNRDDFIHYIEHTPDYNHSLCNH